MFLSSEQVCNGLFSGKAALGKWVLGISAIVAIFLQTFCLITHALTHAQAM